MNLFQENILPLRGMDTTLFQLALVYDWGPNGNIGQYIASHPNAHRPTLVRKAPVMWKLRNVTDFGFPYAL